MKGSHLIQEIKEKNYSLTLTIHLFHIHEANNPISVLFWYTGNRIKLSKTSDKLLAFKDFIGK